MKQRPLLASQDATWALDDAYFEYITGLSGRAMVQRRILECFPSEQEHVSFDGSCAKLAAISGNAAFDMMCAEARADVLVAISIADQVRLGLEPTRAANGTATNFHSSIIATLVWHCEFPNPSGEVLRGEPALRALLKSVADMMSKNDGARADTDALQQLHRFRYRLSSDERADLAKWTQGQLGKNPRASTGGGAGSSAAGSKGCAKQGQVDKEHHAKATVNDLFVS